jgi:hypothetical protein
MSKESGTKKERLTRKNITMGANLRIISIILKKVKKDNNFDNQETLRELLGTPVNGKAGLMVYLGKNKVYSMLNGIGVFPSNTARALGEKFKIDPSYFLGEKLLLKTKNMDYPMWEEFFEAKQKITRTAEGIDQSELQEAKKHARNLETEIEKNLLNEITSNNFSADLNKVIIFLEENGNILSKRFKDIETAIQQIDFQRICLYPNLAEYEKLLASHYEMVKVVTEYRKYES